jgi:hypothetical protein
LWVNAVASASRIQDYIAGPVGSNSFGNKNKIYFLTNLPDFDKWKDWKQAVSNGTDFYDGDYDGIFNPSDKNGNGKWDIDEDRPDYLGQENYWFVYHDGVEALFGRFREVEPQGIEIHQTIFAQSATNEERRIAGYYSVVYCWSGCRFACFNF